MAPRRSASAVLVNPPSLCVEDDRLEPPLGLLYLAAAARRAGFDAIQVADMSGCRNEEAIVACLRRLPEADVYGVGGLCTNHDQAGQVVARLREVAPSSTIVLGGPHFTALAESSLSRPGVDAVVEGEGEDAWVHCLQRVREGSPPRGLIRGTARPEVDSYPFPARDLVDPTTYSRRLAGKPVVSLISSRGCRNHCLHCNSVVMGGGSRHVRYRSPENIVRECADLRPTYECFRFNDDCFTGNPRLPALLERLAPLDLRFRIFASVADLTPETCKALRAAGCVHVAVGVESLAPDNLAAIGKAGQSGHHGNLKVAHDNGIAVRAYFIVGLPFDSDESIERSFAEASALDIDEFVVYPLIPYPGTRLARNPERYGYTIVNPDFRDYLQIGVGRRSCFALRHERFGPDDVLRWKLLAEARLLAGGARLALDSQMAC